MIARTLVDLFILSVLSKELWQLASAHQLPFVYFVSSVMCLSFFLGMGADSSSGILAIRNPIRGLIRTAVAAASLILYLALQQMQGTLWQYAAILAFAVLVYLGGRMVGMAMRGFVYLLLLLITAYFLLRLLVPH
jgi:hypothetical protein